MLKVNKPIYAAVFISIAALAAIIICPLSGIVWISPVSAFTNEEMRYIMMNIRLPRTFVAMLAGGGLAVSGMIFQAIFRNPLADPFTIGVSSGASLGAAICITAGIGGTMLGLPVVIIGAFSGALCSVFLIYAFAWSRDSNSSTLLLAGVIVATICSGLIMFIHFTAGLHQSFQIVRWLMGSVDGVNWQLLLTMGIPLLLFFAVIIPLMPQLDQFLTGDSIAHSRGVNLNASRVVFITVTALAVGAIVAVCGPIGFVGIIAPHACRLVIPGVRHRMLMYCSFLLGGTFLVITDTFARSIVPPTEIPVGIITSILGGPIFLLLLFNRKSRLLV